MRIVADAWAWAVVDAVVGANAADAHLVHVQPGRDWQADEVADIRTVRAGEPCVRCGQPLASARGIEVGHVFKLGTKYSEALGATYLDENGQTSPLSWAATASASAARWRPSSSSTMTRRAFAGPSPSLRTM